MTTFYRRQQFERQRSEFSYMRGWRYPNPAADRRAKQRRHDWNRMNNPWLDRWMLRCLAAVNLMVWGNVALIVWKQLAL